MKIEDITEEQLDSIFAMLAQGVINIVEGHTTIEHESRVHRAMSALCSLRNMGRLQLVSPSLEIEVLGQEVQAGDVLLGWRLTNSKTDDVKLLAQPARVLSTRWSGNIRDGGLSGECTTDSPHDKKLQLSGYVYTVRRPVAPPKTAKERQAIPKITPVGDLDRITALEGRVAKLEDTVSAMRVGGE